MWLFKILLWHLNVESNEVERFTVSKASKLERCFTAGEREMHFQRAIQVLWLIPLLVVSIHFALGFFTLLRTNKRGEWEEFRVYNAYQPFSPLNIFPFMYKSLVCFVHLKYFFFCTHWWKDILPLTKAFLYDFHYLNDTWFKGKDEKVEIVQLGEEKAPGRP